MKFNTQIKHNTNIQMLIQIYEFTQFIFDQSSIVHNVLSYAHKSIGVVPYVIALRN